jgi:hypothetical protein
VDAAAHGWNPVRQVDVEALLRKTLHHAAARREVQDEGALGQRVNEKNRSRVCGLNWRVVAQPEFAPLVDNPGRGGVTEIGPEVERAIAVVDRRLGLR